MKISALSLAVASLLCAGSALASTIQPFQLPWVNGPARDSVYSTTDHPNGVFVLEALQNFCPHCNNNVGAVDELYNKYKSESRVQVVDLDLDSDPGEIQAWLDKYHPAYPVVQDADLKVWNQIGADGIPTVVVMDCKGNIAYENSGEWDDQMKTEISQTIDGLLAQSCAAK
jgi:peroxiredoxin